MYMYSPVPSGPHPLLCCTGGSFYMISFAGLEAQTRPRRRVSGVLLACPRRAREIGTKDGESCGLKKLWDCCQAKITPVSYLKSIICTHVASSPIPAHHKFPLVNNNNYKKITNRQLHLRRYSVSFTRNIRNINHFATPLAWSGSFVYSVIVSASPPPPPSPTPPSRMIFSRAAIPPTDGYIAGSGNVSNHSGPSLTKLVTAWVFLVWYVFVWIVCLIGYVQMFVSPIVVFHLVSSRNCMYICL